MTLKEAWDQPGRMWLGHGDTEVDLSGLLPQDRQQEWWVHWWREYDENLAAKEGLLSV